MARFNRKRVVESLTSTAQRFLAAVSEAHPTETLYAFSLNSSEDGCVAVPCANTEEGFQRRLKNYEPRRGEMEKILAQSGITYEDYTNYYRWWPPEWDFHGGGMPPGDFFVALENEFLCFEDFSEKSANLYFSTVLALKELDGRGLFGRGDKRKSILLHCSTTSYDDAPWLVMESARLLNSPSAFSKFKPQWSVAMTTDEAKSVLANPASQEAYPVFIKLAKKM
jgi:hypothetical protein